LAVGTNMCVFVLLLFLLKVKVIFCQGHMFHILLMRYLLCGAIKEHQQVLSRDMKQANKISENVLWNKKQPQTTPRDWTTTHSSNCKPAVLKS